MGCMRTLRQAVSLVLALALLLAPCAMLSATSSQALASEMSQAMHAGHGHGSHSAHGECHDPLEPDQGGCATDCHNWRVALPSFELQAPDREGEAFPPIAAFLALLPIDDFDRHADRRATVPPDAALQRHASGAPVFALTERYRL